MLITISNTPSNLAAVEAYWDSLGIEHWLYESAPYIEVSQIVVPKKLRKQGIGTKAMRRLCQYADSIGKTIVLSPATDFGATSVARLKEWYKTFRFIENKGRNKDYTIRFTMYRKPQ